MNFPDLSPWWWFLIQTIQFVTRGTESGTEPESVIAAGSLWESSCLNKTLKTNHFTVLSDFEDWVGKKRGEKTGPQSHLARILRRGWLSLRYIWQMVGGPQKCLIFGMNEVGGWWLRMSQLIWGTVWLDCVWFIVEN